eukprot:3213960-Rhodomonas_salina.1
MRFMLRSVRAVRCYTRSKRIVRRATRWDRLRSCWVGCAQVDRRRQHLWWEAALRDEEDEEEEEEEDGGSDDAGSQGRCRGSRKFTTTTTTMPSQTRRVGQCRR